MRVKYLKDLMRLIEKHKINNNELLNIYLNKAGELEPLWVNMKKKKEWLMIAPFVVKNKKSKKNKVQAMKSKEFFIDGTFLHENKKQPQKFDKKRKKNKVKAMKSERLVIDVKFYYEDKRQLQRFDKIIKEISNIIRKN